MLLTSKIVQDTIEACQDKNGKLLRDTSVPHAMKLLLQGVVIAGDEERRAVIEDMLGSALWKKLKDAGQRGKEDAMSDRIEGQGAFEFFGLDERYALDGAERAAKLLDQMLEIEVDRLIALRAKGIEDDQRHLDRLMFMRKTLQPYWRRHPEFTVGQATQELVRERGAAE